MPLTSVYSLLSTTLRAEKCPGAASAFRVEVYPWNRYAQRFEDLTREGTVAAEFTCRIRELTRMPLRFRFLCGTVTASSEP